MHQQEDPQRANKLLQQLNSGFLFWKNIHDYTEGPRNVLSCGHAPPSPTTTIFSTNTVFFSFFFSLFLQYELMLARRPVGKDIWGSPGPIVSLPGALQLAVTIKNYLFGYLLSML